MSTVDNSVPAKDTRIRDEFAVPQKNEGRRGGCPRHLGSQVILLSESERKQWSFNFKNLCRQKLGYNLKDLL